MKKLIGFAATAIFAMSLATAEITVGARGIFGLGLGTTIPNKTDDVKLGACLDFGANAFVKIPLFASLSLQPELGFTHNIVDMKNEDKEEFYGQTYSSSMKMSVSFNAIDIPVLVGWDIKIGDSLTVTPLIGPKFSIVLGKLSYKMKAKAEYNGETVYDHDEKGEADNGSPLLFSIVFGAGVSYKLGPGAIVGDLRYNLGLSEIKTKDSEQGFATPRSLQLSAGYQLSF